jgi:hypothetical protein
VIATARRVEVRPLNLGCDAMDHAGTKLGRTPGIWLWHVQVNIPGAPFGSATSLDEAKAHFKTV